jgi:hypothetical protein
VDATGVESASTTRVEVSELTGVMVASENLSTAGEGGDSDDASANAVGPVASGATAPAVAGGLNTTLALGAESDGALVGGSPAGADEVAERGSELAEAAEGPARAEPDGALAGSAGREVVADAGDTTLTTDATTGAAVGAAGVVPAGTATFVGAGAI